MFGFLVGWGVFWLSLWITFTVLGALAKEDNMVGAGIILSAISFFYLIAVLIGNAVS